MTLSFNPKTSEAATASDYFISTDLKATDFFIDTDLETTAVAAPVSPTSAEREAQLCYKNYCQNVSPSCPVSLLFTRQAAIGNSGIDIVALQGMLVSKKYLVMPANTAKGYFGPMTAAAIARYQDANGLTSSGALDADTLTFLNDQMLTGPACYSFVRYDALTLRFKANIDVARMTPQLNSFGITGGAGQPLCRTSAGSPSCLNAFGGRTFTIYLPLKYGVTKVAAAFLKAGAFDQVSYVPATQRMISSMPALQQPQ